MFALIFTQDEGILIKPGSKQTLKLSWHVHPEFFFLFFNESLTNNNQQQFACTVYYVNIRLHFAPKD